MYRILEVLPYFQALSMPWPFSHPTAEHRLSQSR